uniref:ATP synthase F(0) complex subunit f, mitochondrial n=1 Tax=Vombatus ursinus TaxID=29139 RepID=A0A4X2KG16_VOMUR
MLSLPPEQKLLAVELDQLLDWIMKQDFSPSGIIKAFHRGIFFIDAYFNKYMDVKKDRIGGVSMVLASYILLSYCSACKELTHEWRQKHH